MSKTVIIGGVAGGASAAARLRRLKEDEEIIILEKGDYISYANCGLPYHIGGTIENQDDLLLQTPEMMQKRFNIEVRIQNEVTKINPTKQEITVYDSNKDETYQETYDNLIIATGSSPLRPNIPGIDSPLIQTLWTVNDTTKIKTIIQQDHIQHVTIVGGGFIGLEMAENIKEAGKEVSLVEATNQVMAPLDFDMAQILHKHMQEHGVHLHLEDGVTSFEEDASQILVHLQSGKQIKSDLVLLAIGVRPNSALAKEAGLEMNARGGIIVDQHMRTSIPNIYAVGDVVEVTEFISQDKSMIPLAGPANKQGRIAADNIAGIASRYEGTQASSIVKVFDLTVACTGLNEKSLVKKEIPYASILFSQNSHATYYPGAKPMMIKLLFSKDGSKIYGGQIVGEEGVDKRIDTLGVAIRLGASIHDLKELELAYAPPYSSAKDPINMAGFVAGNLLEGHVSFAKWDEVETNQDAIILDVREPQEVSNFGLENAINIPLGSLRQELAQLDPNKEYIIFCAVGVRAYNAYRLLQQHGFKHLKVYPGGMRYYRLTH
ncbi:MAG: FAD-dependent oxidoreductase [Solobacterium sp.]|nr:FAD-dependent oxidoreductase [Solobacterium sp.]